MPIAVVIEWTLTHTSGGVLRRRRTRIEWRMFLTLSCFLTRRFPVADTRASRCRDLARCVRGLGLHCIREHIDRLAVSFHASFQLDEIGFLEVAAASHHVRL